VEGPLAQALQHPQVTAAVHRDTGCPRVGEFLAAGRRRVIAWLDGTFGCGRTAPVAGPCCLVPGGRGM